MLKVTGLKDKPWAQDLQEVLFYMELLSLGAETTNFIKNRLKKAAGNVLKHEDDLIDAAIKEGIEDVDGFVDELYEVAEQEAKRARKTIGKIEYEILGKNSLNKYIDDAIAKCKAKDITLEIKWMLH